MATPEKRRLSLDMSGTDLATIISTEVSQSVEQVMKGVLPTLKKLTEVTQKAAVKVSARAKESLKDGWAQNMKFYEEESKRKAEKKQQKEDLKRDAIMRKAEEGTLKSREKHLAEVYRLEEELEELERKREEIIKKSPESEQWKKAEKSQDKYAESYFEIESKIEEVERKKNSRISANITAKERAEDAKNEFETQKKLVSNLKRQRTREQKKQEETDTYKFTKENIAQLEKDIPEMEKKLKEFKLIDTEDEKYWIRRDLEEARIELENQKKIKEELERSGSAYRPKLTPELDKRIQEEEAYRKTLKNESDRLQKVYEIDNSSFDSAQQKFDAHIAELKQKKETIASEMEKNEKIMNQMRENGEEKNADTQVVDERIDEVTARIEEMKGNLSGVKETFSDVAKSAGDAFGKIARFAVNVAGKAIRGIPKAFSKIGSAAKKIPSTISKISKGFLGIGKHSGKAFDLKNILRYSLGIRGLYSVFSKLRSMFKENSRTLAKSWDEFNENMSAMHSSLNALKGSFASAFAPIVNTVVPYIAKLCDWLTEAVNKLGEFFAILTGRDYYYAATKANYDYAESAKAAGNASKYLSGLDQMKRWESGGGGGSSVNYEKRTPGEAIKTEIENALKTGDFSAFGDKVAQGIADALNKIDWNNVKAKSLKFSTGIATFLNGLFQNENVWTSIGDTINNGLDTAMKTATNFFNTYDSGALVRGFGIVLSRINWNQLESNGAELGASFGKFLSEKLTQKSTWEQVGRTVSGALQTLFATGSGFLTNLDVSGILDGIVAGLNAINWDDLGEKASTFAANLGAKLQEICSDTETWKTIGDSVIKLINNLIVKPAESFSESFDFETGLAAVASLMTGTIESGSNEHIFQRIVSSFLTTLKTTASSEETENKSKEVFGALAGTVLRALDLTDEVFGWVAEGIANLLGMDDFTWEKYNAEGVQAANELGLNFWGSFIQAFFNIPDEDFAVPVSKFYDRLDESMKYEFGGKQFVKLDWGKMFPVEDVEKAIEDAGAEVIDKGSEVYILTADGIKANVADWIEKNVPNAIKKVSKPAGTAHIEGMIQGVEESAYDLYEELRETLQNGGKEAESVAGKTGEGLGAELAYGVSSSASGIEKGRNSLPEIAKRAFDNTKEELNSNKMKSYAEELVNSFETSVAPISDANGTFNGYFKNAKGNMTAAITKKDAENVGKNVREGIEGGVKGVDDEDGTLGKMFKAVKSNLSKSVTKKDAEEQFAGIASGMNAGLGDIGAETGAITLKFKGMLENIRRTFSKEHAEAIFGDKAGGFVYTIKSQFEGLAEWFDGTFTKAWKSVMDVFSNGVTIKVGESAKGSLTAMMNGVIDSINAQIRSPFREINDMVTTLKNGKYGKTYFKDLYRVDVPYIPYLATGAVIPPNAPFAAVLGDQKNGRNLEMPEKLLRQIVREESVQKGGQYQFTAQINRKTLFSEMIAEAKLEQQKTGINPFKLGRT